MSLILETANYNIESKDIPYVDREEGGHVRIISKYEITNYISIDSILLEELNLLTIIVSEALKLALTKQNIEIGKVDYMNIGPWGNYMCIQIFGRAKNAKLQKWDHNLFLPTMKSRFYDSFKPLNDEDNASIRDEILKLIKLHKYERLIDKQYSKK